MSKFVLVCFLLFTLGLFGQEISLSQAEGFYNNSQFEESAAILRLLLRDSVDDADNIRLINYLLGKSYFMSGDFKRACEHFQKVVDAKDSKEPYLGAGHHWLGRSYGKRAEHASLFTAYKYAVKTREELEKAAALCLNCADVQFDLFEYYLEAPSLLGGGRAKADALSNRIFELNHAFGYRVRSELAEKSKNYLLAEEYLMRAIDAEKDKWWVYVDMAVFLSRRGRFRESEGFFDKAAKIWPDNPALLFERAQMYAQSNQKHGQAVKLLEAYLKSNPIFDYALSRFEARKLLKKLNTNKPPV